MLCFLALSNGFYTILGIENHLLTGTGKQLLTGYGNYFFPVFSDRNSMILRTFVTYFD